MSESLSSLSVESVNFDISLQNTAQRHDLRARDKIRKELIEYEARTFESTEFYREYTQFLIRKFSRLKIIDDEKKVKNINVFYANPERAIAKMKEDRNMVLPVGSISFDRIEDDIARRRVDTTLQQEVLWDETSQRATRVVSLAPKAVVLSYMFHIYTKYTEDMAQLVEQVELLFNPAMDIKTSHSNSIKAYLGDIIDATSLQYSDREDRLVRRQIMINIETYIPTRKFRVTSTGRIGHIINELIVSDG